MKVKVYTTPSCGFCYALKEFLKEHKIPFEEVDVSIDQKAAEEMVVKSGQMGVPVVEIEDKIVVGFDREKLIELLGIQEK